MWFHLSGELPRTGGWCDGDYYSDSCRQRHTSMGEMTGMSTDRTQINKVIILLGNKQSLLTPVRLSTFGVTFIENIGIQK